MPIIGLEGPERTKQQTMYRRGRGRDLRGLGARGGALTYVTTEEELVVASERYEAELERQAYEKTGLTKEEREARAAAIKAKQIADAEAKKAAREGDATVIVQSQMTATERTWEWYWMDFILKVKAFLGIK